MPNRIACHVCPYFTNFVSDFSPWSSNCLSYYEDASTISIFTSDGGVMSWDHLESKPLERKLFARPRYGPQVKFLALGSGGRYFVAYDDDYYQFEMGSKAANNKMRRSVGGRYGSVRSASFGPSLDSYCVVFDSTTLHAEIPWNLAVCLCVGSPVKLIALSPVDDEAYTIIYEDSSWESKGSKLLKKALGRMRCDEEVISVFMGWRGRFAMHIAEKEDDSWSSSDTDDDDSYDEYGCCDDNEESSASSVSSYDDYTLNPIRNKKKKNQQHGDGTKRRFTYKFDLRNTKMCWHGENCPFLNRIDGSTNGCWFAHEESELRCKRFAKTGDCPNGEDCTDGAHTLAPCQLQSAVFNGEPESEGQRPDRNGPMEVRRTPQYTLPSTLYIAQNKIESVARVGFGSNTDGNATHVTDYFCKSDTEDFDDYCDKKTVLEACKTPDWLRWWLRRVLEVEYAQQLSDMRRYDIEYCRLDTSRVHTLGFRQVLLYSIFCAGLQEKRPSVLRGDRIVVRDNATSKYHVGYVFFVNLDSIDVKFNDHYFQPRGNVTYHVQFCLSRTPFNRQFHALERAGTVFASNEKFASTRADPEIESDVFFEMSAYKLFGSPLNPKQLDSVQRLLEVKNKPGSLSLFLLHGPPGTGKTTTLVSFLHSLCYGKQRDISAIRALVCCPSNHAADLICEKLVKQLRNNQLLGRSSPTDVVRLCSVSYDTSKIAADVQHCVPHRDSLLSSANAATVVVCTIMSAGMLWGLGADEHGFDHVVIDEAGQALETEVLVPMMFASKKKGTCVTLAGDPCQLGPIVRSKVAGAFDLGRSTLKRLIDSPSRNKAHCTQLTESYRAHPEILRLYNTLTYNGTLEAKGDPKHTKILEKCNLFPVANRPVAFYHLEGLESREPDSPSWMNLEEANAVVNLTANLLRTTTLRFDDIVILTPYNKQIKKISGILHYKFTQNATTPSSPWYCRGYTKQPPVRVCSVEQFQGREATVIIMSCVRSKRSEEIKNDIVQSIGFLSQPQRLNVAISRPIAGLFIVGNAKVLQVDAAWRNLIHMLGDDGNTRQSSIWCVKGSKQLSLGAVAPASHQKHASTMIKDATSVGIAIPGTERMDGEWHRSQ